MTQQAIRGIATFFGLAFVSATIALAQATTSFEIPITTSNGSWQSAQMKGPTKGKLYVVAVDRPNRRQSCRIQSFTKDKLICARAIGGPRIYLPQQVAALILPGDNEALRLPLWLGFNGGLGAAIWGTVVLAAACPVCAVGTGIAALFCFAAAGVLVYADGQPDRLLYLAPGQELSGKLGYVER